MKSKLFLICILLMIFLLSCATVDNFKTAPEFAEMRPSVVAIMPAYNETVDLDAPKPFEEAVRKAVLSRGYRVAEQELIKNKLKEEGIQVAAQVGAIPDKELGETFGAQALLFTTITSWDTFYVGVYASVTVGARFELIDANTSKVIWVSEDEEKVTDFATDKDAMKHTAAFAAITPYEPLAKALVYRVFKNLPQGPYATSPMPQAKPQVFKMK